MTYLVAAFALIWLLVALYVVYMVSRQRTLEREIEMLDEAVVEMKQRKK